jgi:hypothetical protein
VQCPEFGHKKDEIPKKKKKKKLAKKKEVHLHISI